MSRISQVWHSQDEIEWKFALSEYWNQESVRRNLQLERKFEKIDRAAVCALTPDLWYKFLFDEYFRWKYTAPNRLATTRAQLARYLNGKLEELNKIKDQLFSFDMQDIENGLKIASSIHGLGIAGASGLLAVLFPESFGTVDQFAVQALAQIDRLPEVMKVRAMKPLALTPKDGEVLIQIMRRKARENNIAFATDFWTPRRIDMVLWTLGH
jgi:hypothetical protein